MQLLTNILVLLGAGVLLFLSYSMIKRHPGAFSSTNINKSFFTLGILALLLIGFIAVLVWLLKP